MSQNLGVRRGFGTTTILFAASVNAVCGERKVRSSTRVVLRSPDIGANVKRWGSSKLNNMRDLGGLNFRGVLLRGGSVFFC